MKYTLALLLMMPPLLAISQVDVFDHFVDNETILPGFEDQVFQLHVREKVRSDIQSNPAHDYTDQVVVMVHGNSVPAPAVFDLEFEDYSWMGYLAAAGYDVYAMSMTGYGLSTRPQPMQDSCNVGFFDRLAYDIDCGTPSYGFTMVSSDSEMDDLDAVVEFVRQRRGVERVTLIGHSLGGFRVMLYASRFPEKINKVITHGFSGASFLSQANPPDPLPSEGSAISLLGRSEIAELWAEATCRDQFDPAVLDPAWEAIASTDPLSNVWSSVEEVSRHPTIDLYGLTNDTIETIAVPTLVLIGEVDNIAPPFAASAFYDRLASTEKVFMEINRTSHAGYWEERKEIIYELCREWLEETQIAGRSTGKGIFKLNETIDWIGEFDDQTPPQVASTFPADSTFNVPLEIDLELILDENISGLAEHLTVFRAADNSVFDYIELDNEERVTQICSNILNFDIPALEEDTDYYVYVHFDAFIDRSFNAFEGILTDKEWRFSTGEGEIVNTTNVPENRAWTVAPNPARNQVHLIIGNEWGVPAHFRILNARGQLVTEGLMRDNLEIDSSTWPTGLYFVQVRDTTTWTTQKLVIQ